jgi:hypothetical protein
MRRLLEIGLAGARPAGGKKQPARAGKKKALEMAGREIDSLGDKSASDEEQAKRKRRLLKGPSEFRDMRVDHPKPKQ